LSSNAFEFTCDFELKHAPSRKCEVWRIKPSVHNPIFLTKE